MRKFILYCIILITPWNCVAENLIINELMQSNIDCIMDDLNDFPDSWVELYNPTNTVINLKDYKIGTKNNIGKAWQLPDAEVSAHGYIIIYCDKAGTEYGVSAMHTDFRLESTKESKLYLFQKGVVVDFLQDIDSQPAPNIAYGRKTDGAEEWGYQAVPTPGSSNCGTTCTCILGSPVFGTQGQVITSRNSISLELSLPEGSPEGTQIRYTTDGSEPTQTSTPYTHCIDIHQNTIVRARLFCSGYLSPRSTCHSYLFFPADRELTLSVMSITTDNRYLNDKQIGILVDGTYTTDKKNFEYDWRRPMNVELFEGEGSSSVINQLCEARVGGGATRIMAKKSMILYANKRFGIKRLDYEFFPDQKPGLHDFKSIMLRNAGNDFDFLYMRDAIIQRTIGTHVDIDWQAWRPVIIYINGEYQGILNIRERSNEDHIYTNYNGMEDIDMIENNWELKEGTRDHYRTFKAFYQEPGHTLAEYAQWMDIEEYINLMIGNIYFCNNDFPGNNNVMWRPRTANGKWRWIMKDTDFGLGLQGRSSSYNMVEWLYNPDYDADANWGNQPEHTILFRHLMEDPDFKRQFLDRAAVYMGDFLNEKGTCSVWDPMYEMIRREYPFHRALINPSWPNYDEERNSVRTWLHERTDIVYDQLADYYQWGKPVQLTVNKESQSELTITINNIPLTDKVFEGKYYAGRTIILKAQGNEGMEVKGWRLAGAVNQVIKGEELTITMPDKHLAINPIFTDTPENEGLIIGDTPIYDLLGKPVSTLCPGNIYIQNKRKYLFW